MTQPTDVGGVHLRVYDVRAQTLLSVVPEFSTVTVQDERNQPGQLSTTLPLSAKGVAVLAGRPSAMLSLWEAGSLIGWYLYDEDDGDDADAAGPDAALTVTAPGALKLLEWAQIYPQTGFGTDAWVDFTQATPGTVLLELLQRAQARGTLDGVNGPLVQASFSEDADSDGTPWPTSVWIRYEAGKTMLDVVNDLCQRGYVDVRMNGLTLDAYVANGSSDVARSPIATGTAMDAQGWTAVSGCTVARDATVLPTDVPGVTGSVALTASIPGISGLQAQVTSTQATLDAAQKKLNDDTIAYNNAAAKAKRQLTSAEKAALAADQRSLANAQKAYSAAVSALSAANAATPATDMTAGTSATFPVQGGVSYDASIEVHADAVTRVCVFSLDFHDAGGADLGETVVGSTTDSPSGWGTIAGTITTPVGATNATARYRVAGAAQDEKHYAARPALSTSTGTTVTQDLPAVVLHGPDYVQGAPRRRQRDAIRTALLGLGEGRLSLEAKDDDAVALYGRREGVASQGGISDYPTLQRLTQLALDQAKRPALGWTVTYQRVTGDGDVPVPQPWRDYYVGNLIRCDWLRAPDLDPLSTSTALAPVRVSSITASYDAGGVTAATLELADLFEDQDVKIARQIQGLLLGASSANPLGAGNDTGPDDLAPAAVSAVFIGSSVLLHDDGTYEAVATINWDPVLSNQDGTPYDDPGWYQVDYRIGDWPDETGGWQGGLTTQDTHIGVGRLTPQTTMQARVLVVDASGNYPKVGTGDLATPDYGYSAPTELVADDVGPGAPSAPTVVAVPGGLSVSWDGQDNAGVAMPPDYTHVEVHVSTVNAFTPTPATLADTIVSGTGVGSSTVLVPPLLTYGVDYYVRLVAYDSAGNASQPGVQTGPRRMQLIGPADLDPTALTNTDHSGMFNGDTGFTTGGAVVADATARDGNARQLAANSTAAGVGYAGLKPGRYRATWYVRTTAGAASPPTTIGSANVTGTGVTSDGARAVTTADVSNGQGYRSVSVRFTVTAAVNSVDLPLTNTSGTMTLSHAYIEPVVSIAVAEIRDAMVADLSATKLTAGVLTADVIAAQDAFGNPGRIRVGIVNAGTGQPNASGFSVGSDGIYAQAPGGTRTLVIDTAGNITVTGSITAGSAFPGSVYGQNLVANASMEDLAPNLAAGSNGILPTAWLDNWQGFNAGTAFADRSTVLGGSQSLTVQPGGGNRLVASSAFPVQPGERLQVAAQLRRLTSNGPCYVALAFGTSNTFSAPAGATPATADNCVILNLDGTVASTGASPSSAVGIAYVLGGASTPALSTSYKVTGSVVVPSGSTWCRLVLGANGSGSLTFDNVGVIRAPDGMTMSSATITGPTLRTAATGQRVEISGPASTSIWTGAGVNFYASDSVPPARIQALSQGTAGGTNLFINIPYSSAGLGTAQMPGTIVEFMMGNFAVAHTDPSGTTYANIGFSASAATDGLFNIGIGTATAAVRSNTQVTNNSFMHQVVTSAGQATVLISTSGSTPTDPSVSFAQPAGLAGAIASFRYASSNQCGGLLGGPGSNVGLQTHNVNVGEFKVTNGAFSAFAAIRAAAFNPPSTVEYKKSVASLPDRYALDAVRFAPARTWSYKPPRSARDQPTGSDDPALHVFPILEDLPSEVWADDTAVDLRDVVGLLWQAVREQADESETELAALRAEVASLRGK